MIGSTAEKAGYTGNSYCRGCNTKLSDGTVIPVTSNVGIGEKSDLSTAVGAMEKVLNDQSSVYTDEQKKLLVDSINAVRSALESIENAEEAVKKADAMPAADKTRPDDKTAMDAYEAAREAYDALTEDEKRMAGERTKATLDAMLKALTAYEVTSGDGSTWTENDNDLCFIVNGYHQKLTDVVINGVAVDKKYYEIGAGSTVITLKGAYLQTLPAGEYTLLVRYTDGSTDGEDTFTITENVPVTPSDPADPSAPKTENDHKPIVWISVTIVCAGILTVLLLFFIKRKKEKKE